MGPLDGGTHPPPLVLVAVDESERRRRYVACLATEGYRVEEACDFAEVVEKARELDPTVVVVDLSVPGDAFELTRLKASSDVRDVCVVALVSPSEAGQMKQVEGVGADVCVLKPCSPTTLLEYVRTCVAGYGRR